MQQRRGRFRIPTRPGVSRVKVRVGTDEAGLRPQDFLVWRNVAMVGGLI